MVRRVIEQLDGLSDMVGKLHHAIEELGSPAIAFRTVVSLDLEPGKGMAFVHGEALPPVVQGVHDEVAGLRRTAEGEIQLPAVLVDQTEWRVLFLTAHIVVGGLVITPSFPAAGIIPDVHGGLAVHAQSLGLASLPGFSVLFMEIGEEGIGLWNFFWGLALSTGRSR